MNRLLFSLALLVTLSATAQNCQDPVAEYIPLSFNSSVSDIDSIAQVFTAGISAQGIDVTLEIATCKANGIGNAKLELLSVTGGVPDWDNVLDSAFVMEPDIYGWPGCVPDTFGAVTFTFNNANIISGNQYALLIMPAYDAEFGANIYWRMSDTQTDGTNPYSGGDTWTTIIFFSWSVYDPNDFWFSICGTEGGSSIVTDPTNLTVGITQTAQFEIVASDSLATYQWQMDNGGGFTDVINAGQYSGALSNTLQITNASMANDQLPIRCIVYTTDFGSDTSSISVLTVVENLAITELGNNSKQVVKILDLLGRETRFKPNTPLIYIYSDGSRERVFKVE